jgi:N-acetylglucosaminyl-diphospho-decaprenol L-rhamnosyltransferase
MANVMMEERERATPRMEPRALDLSILIVTWNSERWIDRCLRSIPAACAGLEYEVVIHDNSTDNAGFAGGTNRAFRNSTGRYVFLLNPDCELESGAVTSLFQFLESHPEIAAAAPLLRDEGGESQRNFQLRRLPTLAALTAEALMIDKVWPGNPVTAKYRYRDLDLTEPQRIEQPAAAALLLRREVVDEIGPLDEQFAPAWFEDVDYCRRLAGHEKEIWVVPAAHAQHFGGASLEHMDFAGFVDIWYRNMWRYAHKWMRPGQAELLRWAIVSGMLLRCAAGIAGLRPRGVRRWDAFRGYAAVLRKAVDRWDSSPSSS